MDENFVITAEKNIEAEILAGIERGPGQSHETHKLCGCV
jgi:hypothetical protein